MFEPHLVDHASIKSSRRQSLLGHSEDPTTTGSSLLEELDKIAPLKSFDAFPKVQATYTVRSRRGGVLTAVVGFIIFLLVLVGYRPSLPLLELLLQVSPAAGGHPLYLPRWSRRKRWTR